MNNDVILEEDKTCPATAYQTSIICVPVSVKPFAQTGNTKTKCCGNPVVVSGTNRCLGVKDGECVFTISQSICVEVPVELAQQHKLEILMLNVLVLLAKNHFVMNVIHLI